MKAVFLAALAEAPFVVTSLAAAVRAIAARIDRRVRDRQELDARAIDAMDRELQEIAAQEGVEVDPRHAPPPTTPPPRRKRSFVRGTKPPAP